jgi:hypothetical protein
MIHILERCSLISTRVESEKGLEKLVEEVAAGGDRKG